jgi:hypothetical protein
MYKLDYDNNRYLISDHNKTNELVLFGCSQEKAIRYKYRINIALLVLQLVNTAGVEQNKIIRDIIILVNKYNKLKKYEKVI